MQYIYICLLDLRQLRAFYDIAKTKLFGIFVTLIYILKFYSKNKRPNTGYIFCKINN